MPSPGTPAPQRLPIEDSYLELLAETLEGLDLSARGQFLQRYFRAITHLDLRENQCVPLWDQVLSRRRELSETLNRQISIKTALMDVVTTEGFFRVPILIEYDALKKLEVSAVTDSLTGLYNRRTFSESFEKELNRAKRYALPLGLVILDMHRFKEVNDKHGHLRGDDVLRAAAATLRKALRTSDSAFRIGGDEFALLLPQTDAAQTLALSRRIEAVFEETLLPLRLSVRVSMDHGNANYPQDGEQAEQLIRTADERLYRLKQANHGKTSNESARSEPTPADAPAHVPQEPQLAVEPEEPAAAPAPAPVQAPISIESRRPAEKTPEPLAAAAAATVEEISGVAVAPSSRLYTMPRKAERVSMTGTNAYAVLGEQGAIRARVLDLGFGGVALELESPEAFRDSTLAVLHVPILPPVRVNLKRVWSQRSSQGFRVGCSFIS
ncbi:MAG: hypothetical protein NVS9B4_23730 [Candidatus Acidiferrum sp.]